MKTLITLLVLLLSVVANGQELYIKTFGKPTDKPLIFLHGGPGYNCSSFEVSTAKNLSKQGYYVIVYDRRGEGRSTDVNAQFTFKETFDDINNLYKKFGLKKATLIGHSFGGVIATLYAEKNPNSINSIVLVGAPISLQETFKTIINTSKDIYNETGDEANLKYITILENMDTNSIQYSSYCFMHAMQNGFYSPKNPTIEAKNIYSQFKTDTILLKHASNMTYEPPQGFWQNEKYTIIDISTVIKKLQLTEISIYALYGKEDGLYSKNQILTLLKIISEKNLNYFENCSHSVFIDQQSKFIASLNMWLK